MVDVDGVRYDGLECFRDLFERASGWRKEIRVDQSCESGGRFAGVRLSRQRGRNDRRGSGNEGEIGIFVCGRARQEFGFEHVRPLAHRMYGDGCYIPTGRVRIGGAIRRKPGL